jgi:Raf kinase inhibitor-like YbhB/YbcL family protein
MWLAMKKLVVVAFAFSVVVALIILSYLYIVPVQKLEVTKTVKLFKLSSTAFSDGRWIPERYTCIGLDVSPPLRWEGYPFEAESFTLIVEDVDAPRGVFTHWIIYNIPRSVSMLEEGVEKVSILSSGAMQGLNDFGRIGCGGPCPPAGKPHRYTFNIFTLNIMLDVKPAASKNEILKALQNHIIGEAELTGIFLR